MNIYLALLLCVAGFALGWVMGTLRQRSTIKGLELERVSAQATVEQYRSALNIIAANRVYTDSVAKPLSAATASQKSNSSPRYEPS